MDEERERPFDLPYELQELLALSGRQKAVLRAVTAGFTPQQLDALKDWLEAVEKDNASQRAQSIPAVVRNEKAGNDGWPSVVIALMGVAAGMIAGGGLAAALTPPRPPSLKSRFANWLLSEL